MTNVSPAEPRLQVLHPPSEPVPSAASGKGMPRPKLFRALGTSEPPPHVEVGDCRYELIEVLKHDSWAATAVYASAGEKIVCKFNRQQRIGPVGMKWLGRRLAARENYLLRKLSDLPNVPGYRGPVTVDGQPQRNVAAHVFVEGHPLRRDETPSEAFFTELYETLETMHRRGVVYVDLHKAENILVGDDGRCHLIDFQVCYIRPANRLLAGMLLWWERMLEGMDRYHFRKHLCRHRPDLSGCTLAEMNRLGDRPWWIKVHRSVAAPLRSARRGLLVWLGIRKGKGKAETEHFAEDAIRQQAVAEDDLRKAA